MLSIVNYHYIRESFDADYPSIFGVTPSQFKKQILLLKNQGDFIGVSEFNNNYEAILKSKENFHLITFDDGLKEQFVYGNSILDELNLEAYYFLNAMNFKDRKVSQVHKTHLLRSVIAPEVFLTLLHKEVNINFSDIDKERSYKVYRFDDKISAELKYFLNFVIPYESKELIVNKIFNSYFNEKEVNENLYMTHNQIMSLSDKEMIGNHTYSHKNLGLLNDEELHFEIEASKEYLEALTQSKINTISYPYGTEEVYNNKVLNTSKNTLHKFGFTVKKGINTFEDDLLLLKRFDCNDLIGGKNYEN